MSSRSAADALATAPFFSNASSKGIETLAERTTLKTFVSDETIFAQGDPSRQVFLVESGVVGIYMPGDDGNRQTQATLRPGSLFGELGVLAGRARTATAACVEDCSLWVIEGEAFLGVFSSQPQVAIEVVTSLARYVLDSEGVAEDLLFLDLKGRLAKRLLHLAGVKEGEEPAEPVGDIVIDLSELASLSGGTRVAIEGVLESFESEGLIGRSNSGSINLLRPIDLAELART